MRPVAPATSVEIGWSVPYGLKYAEWRRVRRAAEAGAGGPVPLDDRTLVAIHGVRRLERDECRFNADLIHILQEGGWRIFGAISSGTPALHAALAWLLFGPPG